MLYISRNGATLSFLIISLIIAAITSTKAEPVVGPNSAKKINRVGLDSEIDVDNGLEDAIREKRMSNLGIKINRPANLTVEGSAGAQGPSSGSGTVGNLHNGDRCDPNKGGCADVARCAPNPVEGLGACVCKNATSYGKECKQTGGSFLASTITPFQFPSETNSTKFLRYQYKAHATIKKYEALMTLLKGERCDPKWTPSADEIANFFTSLDETRPIVLKEIALIIAKATEMANMGSLKLCDYRQFLRCDNYSSRCDYIIPGVVSEESKGPEGKLYLFLGPGSICYEPAKMYELKVEVSCKWGIDGSCGHTNPGRCICPDGFTGKLCDEVVRPTTIAPSTEPVSDPVLDLVSDPVADPVADPVTDPVTDPDADPDADPVADLYTPGFPIPLDRVYHTERGQKKLDPRIFRFRPRPTYDERDIPDDNAGVELDVPTAGIISGYGKSCNSFSDRAHCGDPGYMYCKPMQLPLNYIYQYNKVEQSEPHQAISAGSLEEDVKALHRKRRSMKYQRKKVDQQTMSELEAVKIRDEEWKKFDEEVLLRPTKDEDLEQDVANGYTTVNKRPKYSCRCNKGLAPKWHKHGFLTCSLVAGSSCRSNKGCASNRCSKDDKTHICIKSIKGLLFMPAIYMEYAKEELQLTDEVKKGRYEKRFG